MSTPSNDPMAEIKASFFLECDDLLEALQDGLQVLEDTPDETETINVVFRAVHSIKGGAGAFGLDELVRFSHRFETVLDAMRNGTLSADAAVLRTLYVAADFLADLVDSCRNEIPVTPDSCDAILAQLDALLGADPLPADDEPDIAFEPTTLALDLDLGGDQADLPPLPPLPDIVEDQSSKGNLIIRFRPHVELFNTGNEPLLLLKNLQDLGTAHCQCDSAALPDLDQLVPDLPHLSWTITLDTDADVAEVQSVFEFVEGLCDLQIETADALNSAPGPEVQTQTKIPGPDQSPDAAVAPATAETLPSSSAPTTSTEPAPENPAADKPATVQIPAAPATTAKPPAAPKSVVRVDLDRIERLVNLVGELVINQAMLSQSLERSGMSPHSDAMDGLEEFQRLTRDIQDSVMMIRAQPVKSLFQRMSRIVREASSAVDKEVRLRTEGETTEVDKTVIERLADPLTHMIRNAVDHGLEPTEDRLAAGKSATGTVTLTAAHRSGRVVIEVADDGGGINHARVQQIAIDKGLIPADAVLTDTEINNLLFLPGFSTSAEVSDLSGRGVGMDVVRTEIQALGGRVTISSEPGHGTSFSISLPLTLAVLDGMVIDVAQETLVLPVNQVVETLTLEAGQVQQVRPGSHVVKVREEFVPLIDLGAHLGYRPPLEKTEGAVILLISHEEGTRAALLIDGVLDQRQVVIKGLEDGFYRAPGIAAATILGDGQIALILDPSDIMSQALKLNGGMPTRALPEGVSA